MAKIEDLSGFISFPPGFKLLGPVPIDARYAGENEEFLTSIVENNSAYPGLKVYIKSTNKFYSYKKDVTGEYSFIEDNVSLTPEQQAALDSGITSEKVSEIDKKYSKPETGIPMSDLSKDVEDKIVEVASTKAREVSDSLEVRITSISGVATEALTKSTITESEISNIKLKNTEQDSEISKIKEDVNKLPTEEKVISLIAKNSGRRLSSNADGDPFISADQLISGPWFYNGVELTKSQLNEGDQAYISASEGVTSKTMSYTGGGWAIIAEGSYQFTEDEKAVLNSGITSEKVDQIEVNKQGIADERSRAEQAETEVLSDANSYTDSKISEHSGSTESHQDIRSKVDEIESLANEAKSISETGVSKAESAQEAANLAQESADQAQSTANSANTLAGEAKDKADLAKSAADEAKDMVNDLEERVDTKLVTKQNSLNGGGDNNTNILMQPVSKGGDPQLLSKESLIYEIDESKIQPVKEELQLKITEVENKNDEQDTDIAEVRDLANQAKGIAESKVGSVVEGSTDGSISVDGSDVKVHGLKGLAYKDSISKDEVGLGNVTNDQQATKEEFDSLNGEFNSLKNKVRSLEQLGQFVGSYETYTSLPKLVSDILGKYGELEISVNDFATVRKGPYPPTNAEGNPTGLEETDVTCWSIYRIDGETLYWAYEFTYDIDISGKTDKVTDTEAENKIATFDETGNLKVNDGGVTVSGLTNDIAAAMEMAESKYSKPDNGIPEDDLNQELLAKIKSSIKGVAPDASTPGGLSVTNNEGISTSVQVGGLGNLAGKSVTGEGLLKQDSNGDIEAYRPFIVYIGKDGNGPAGIKETNLGWNSVVTNGVYSLTLTAKDYGNKGKISNNLYLPKVRVFWVESPVSLTETIDSISLDPSTGTITIESNYPKDLVIMVE